MSSLLKTNTFKVVGRLANADMKTGNRRDNGAGYISGNITVVSNLDGRNNEFEISFFANQTTKDGKESALFTSYSKLNELIGKKVEVTGYIGESRFFSTKNNQMVSSQKLNGRFVRGVSETTAEEANFELAGFVVDTLKEKTTKDNSIYRYDLTIGQSNFSDTSMSKFVLHVQPSAMEIVRGVQNYQIGQTVSLNGDLRFIVEQMQSKKENIGGFGEPVVRTYVNKQHNFYITGGTAAITDLERGMYPTDVIKTLVGAYKAHDVELANNVKDRVEETPAEESPKASFRQASLI